MCDEPDEDIAWYSGLPSEHSLEVTVTDNPVIGVLYGPDGRVLAEVHEREVLPFGFNRQ